MGSTGDAELPSATIEKPALDPISIAPSEDALANSSENLSKIKSAKNIGTATPEVEGEENEPIDPVEEFPSTPVSASDPIFQALPLTMESKEDSLPLPPTPEETSPSGISEEAEVGSLHEPSVVEAEQLDGPGEPEITKEEGLDGIEGETTKLKETETKDGEQAEEVPGVESSTSHGEQPVASPAHVSVTQEPEIEVEAPVAEGGEEKEEDPPIMSGDTSVALEATDLDSRVLETARPVTDENSDTEPVGNSRGAPEELAHTGPEPLTEEHFESEDSIAEIAQPQNDSNIETHYALDSKPDIEALTPEKTTEGDSEEVIGQSEVVKSELDDIPLDDGSGDIPSGVSSGKEGGGFSEVKAGPDENGFGEEAEVHLETFPPPEEVELPQTSADETAQASRESELAEPEELVPEGVPEPVTSPVAPEIVETAEDVESGTPKDTQETEYSSPQNPLDEESEPVIEARAPLLEELAPEGVPEPVTSPVIPAIVEAAEDVESGTPKDTQTTDDVEKTEYSSTQYPSGGENEPAIEAEAPLLEALSPSGEVELAQTSADETAQVSRESELAEPEELVPEGVPEPVTSPEAPEIVATAEDVESGAPEDTQTTDSVGQGTEHSIIGNSVDGEGEVTEELESMTVTPLETDQSTGAEHEPTGAGQLDEGLAPLAQSSEAQLPDPEPSPSDASASEQVAPVSREDEPQEALKDELPLEELSETIMEAESAASEPSPTTLEQEPAAPGLPGVLKVEPSLEELAEALGETEGTGSDLKLVETSIEAPAVVTELPLERTGQESKESVVTEPGAQLEVEECKETEEPAMGDQLPNETPEREQSVSDQDPIVTQHVVEVDEPIIEPEVEAEGSEESTVEQENTVFNQIPEEITNTDENGIILESPSVSADAGTEEPQEEEAKAPLAESQTEEPVDRASIDGSGMSGESIGVPLVLVEKTADNQPSHGEDLGPNATVGQKEAFELRRADAEPDKVITVVELPMPSVVPTEGDTCEPASTKPNAETGVSVESTEEPGPESLEEDEPVIISHDDAPLEDVEKAEAAVDLPVPEILGESNGPGGVDTKTTVNTDASAYTQQEEEAHPAKEDSGNLSQEAPQDPPPAPEPLSNFINPTGNEDEPDSSVLKTEEEGNVHDISVLASETTGNAVVLVPSEEVSWEANASVHGDVELSLEAIERVDAPDLGETEMDEETMPDEAEIPVTSGESTENTLDSGLSRGVEDFVAPREQEDNFAAIEETPVLKPTEDLLKTASEDPILTSETSKPIDVLREGMSNPYIEPNVVSGEDGSHESADASDPVIPIDGGDAQRTSVPLFSASEPLGDPTELASGEEVPQGVETSVDTVVEPDAERLGASNSTGEPEGFSTGLFPTSESSANPTDSQPGESPPGIGENSAELGVVLENESEGEHNASSLSSEKAQSPKQELSVDTLPSSSMPPSPIVDTRDHPVSLLPSVGAPLGLAPSGGMSKDLDPSSIHSSVELNEESYEKVDHSSLGAEVVAEQSAKPEESADILGGKAPVIGLAAAVGIGLVGALAGEESFDGKVGHEDIREASFVIEPTPALDPEIGSTEAPAVEETVDIIPAPVKREVLPDEISSEVPLQELSEHPATSSTTEIEPGLTADKSAGEILSPGSPDADSAIIGITKDKSSDKKLFQASAIDVPDEASVLVAEVLQSKDKSVVRGDKQIKSELPSQNSSSPAHGVAVLEVDVPEIAKADDASKAPAIVISSPPGSPAKGDVTEPTPEILFDEGSANRARESENTPEGVRKRKIPGGEASRPTSSGTDTVSTRHHRNVMNTFWHVLFFGWLGGFGRFFGGMFSKSKKTRK